MDSAGVIYAPRPDATPVSERAALAAVYRFILKRCIEKNKVAVQSDQDDAKGVKDHVRAKRSIP